ncbi:MAG: hypothetical protein GY836_18080 [Herbaspirillum sp.]|uniref:hypothetical protein n=1 Tax=Herbaspirillum sp. TaxID=1890675 RepID=UPI002588531E|nr:hypothetical protein [Herbaspirillum sp.]MCP4557318.1 hypothetical protein [Herbaspirillum sp.]
MIEILKPEHLFLFNCQTWDTSKARHTFSDLQNTHTIPDYVTPKNLVSILQTIHDQQIRPRHPGCDMTAEIAADCPEMSSIMYHMERKRNEPSIYQGLYDQLKSENLPESPVKDWFGY